MEQPSSKTILIVDDDVDNQCIFKVLLSEEGFKVLTASSGNTALNMLKEGVCEKIDLVLLDLLMPGRGGYDVIKMLQEPGYQEVPIIVMTARTVKSEVVDRYENEPNVKGFFFKPVASSQLKLKVHELLGTVSPKTKTNNS